MSIEREYVLTYTVQAGQAATALDQVTTKLYQANRAAQNTTRSMGEANTALASFGTNMQQVGSQVGDVSVHFGNATQRASMFKEAIASIGASMFVMEQVGTVTASITEIFAQARKNAAEMAKEVKEVREGLRELANLKGANGPDDIITAEVIQESLKTGATIDEVTRFEEQFEGSIPAGREKGNLGPAGPKRDKLEKDIKQVGLEFATRTGIGMSTAGDLTGVLGQYGKIDKKEDAAGMMGAIAYGANEGRGHLEALIKAILKTSGTVVEEGGKVNDLAEFSAIVGVASIGNSPDTAGNRVLQASRELRRFDGKRGESLKEIGVTKDDDFMQSLRKIAPHIAGKDGDLWLQEHGFQNRDGNKGLIFLAKNMGLVEERIKKAEEIRQNGGAVIEQNERFKNEEKAGQARMADVNDEARRKLKGIEEQELATALQFAQQRRQARGEIGLNNSMRENIMDAGGLMPRMFNIMTTREQENGIEAVKMITEQAQRAGIDINKYDLGGGGGRQINPHEFARLSRDIKAQGVDSIKGDTGDNKLNNKLDELVKLTREANHTREKIAAKKPAQQLPAKAPVAPRRP